MCSTIGFAPTSPWNCLPLSSGQLPSKFWNPLPLYIYIYIWCRTVWQLHKVSGFGLLPIIKKLSGLDKWNSPWRKEINRSKFLCEILYTSATIVTATGEALNLYPRNGTSLDRIYTWIIGSSKNKMGLRTLTMKALCTFETSGIDYPVRWRCILEEGRLQENSNPSDCFPVRRRTTICNAFSVSNKNNILTSSWIRFQDHRQETPACSPSVNLHFVQNCKVTAFKHKTL